MPCHAMPCHAIPSSHLPVLAIERQDSSVREAKKNLEECLVRLETTFLEENGVELSKYDVDLGGRVKADEANATGKEFEAQMR
jgi:hypothetical protein